MDEQDKKLLELYLKDIRKKKIIFLIITIIFIIIFTFSIFYNKYKKTELNKDNIIQNEIDTNTIIEKDTNVESNSNVAISEIKDTTDKEKETTKETQKNNVKENLKEETKENNKEKIETTKVEEKKNDKPSNKDFLFKDGYTMDNVTEEAQKYLKSSGYAGECIPLKDNEGVYIGMRVIFY